MLALSGLDISLDATILGTLQGMIGGYIKSYLDFKFRSNKMLTEAHYKDIANARSIIDPVFKYTCAILAIVPVVYICIAPFVAWIANLPVTVFYEETNGWLLSFLYDNTTIHIITVPGIPITPAHSYLASAGMGFYLCSRK